MGAYEVLTHAEQYCRRHDDLQAAEVLNGLVRRTMGYAKRQRLLKQDIERWERQAQSRRAQADIINRHLPAGLHACVSYSALSESEYCTIVDAAGNVVVEVRVSGHIRPSGPHPHEFGRWADAEKWLAAKLKGGDHDRD